MRIKQKEAFLKQITNKLEENIKKVQRKHALHSLGVAQRQEVLKNKNQRKIKTKQDLRESQFLEGFKHSKKKKPILAYNQLKNLNNSVNNTRRLNENSELFEHFRNSLRGAQQLLSNSIGKIEESISYFEATQKSLAFPTLKDNIEVPRKPSQESMEVPSIYLSLTSSFLADKPEESPISDILQAINPSSKPTNSPRVSDLLEPTLPPNTPIH